MQLKTKSVELEWRNLVTSICISEIFSSVHVISWYATSVITKDNNANKVSFFKDYALLTPTTMYL